MTRYRILPDRSRLWAEARSSLHPILVETVGFEGYVEVEASEGRPVLGLPTLLELDVERLKSGNALLDRELQRRLEARKYSRVIGEVREVKPLEPGTRYRLRGELSLHGITRTIEGTVALRAMDDRTIEVEGEQVIDMRDFGLNPPRILMLRVQPEVRVRARVVAERED